jgi:hypothetical protein
MLGPNGSAQKLSLALPLAGAIQAFLAVSR